MWSLGLYAKKYELRENNGCIKRISYINLERLGLYKKSILSGKGK